MSHALPWFPMHPSDFLSSQRVAIMSAEEVGALCLLLMFAWGDRDCSIPADDVLLARLTRTGDRWEDVRTGVLDCWAPHPTLPGRLINPRLFEEWQRSAELIEKRRQAGRTSGESRRNPVKKPSPPPSNTCSTPAEQVPDNNRYSNKGKTPPNPPRGGGDAAKLERKVRSSPIMETALRRAQADGLGAELDAASRASGGLQRFLRERGYYAGPVPEPAPPVAPTESFPVQWIRRRARHPDLDPQTSESWRQSLAECESLRPFAEGCTDAELEALRLEALAN